MSKHRIGRVRLAAGPTAVALAVVLHSVATAAQPLIPAGGEVTYHLTQTPPFADQLVHALLGGLKGAVSPAPASELNFGPELPPPVGWPNTLPNSPTGLTPIGVGTLATCKCKHLLAPGNTGRISVVRVLKHFHIDDTLAVGQLVLRTRYQDGIVVHINGRELVRVEVPRDAVHTAPARRLHGPEWETLYLPALPGILHHGQNTLAIEVRPSAYREGPWLDFELSTQNKAKRLLGPWLEQVGTDSAVVRFVTNRPVRAHIEYGVAGLLNRSASSAGGGLAQVHRVTLAGLAPGQSVDYRLVVDGVRSAPWSFHTPPPPGSTIRFAVYGDMRGGHRTHEKIVKALIAEAPDFVLVTGDLVLRGSDVGDWQRFFEVAAPLLARVPYYPAAGNHDLGRSGAERRRMNERFSLGPRIEDRPDWGHWYNLRIGDVELIMLDSNAYPNTDQKAWLARTLDSAKTARAVFAVTHDGPYSRGPHRGNRYAAKNYAPALAKAGVDMLFAGHDHLYQRGKVNNLPYVVSGGGGAPLYPVRCGAKGKPRCKQYDGMKRVAREHHYLMVTVHPKHFEMCPRRIDRTLIEPCRRFPLRAQTRH